MRIAFWNTHNNISINSTLSDLWIEQKLDLLILSEYKDDANQLIATLRTLPGCDAVHKLITAGCDRITILSKYLGILPGDTTPYCSVQIIPNHFILGCIHLTSSIYDGSSEMRAIEVGDIMEIINNAEADYGLKSIIVGDFNMNPYDKECLKASRESFHALPTKEDALKLSRTVASHKFTTFYNPMWNFLGDYNPPSGTHYYGGSKSVNTFWNIIDQVILRPELINRFQDKELCILTSIDSISLLSDDKHPDIATSDHLPIVFEVR